ncbi:MAG TPA: GrpB family protein [Variovorax sp.]
MRPVLPSGADIDHVGATAVPGCLSKGDLDIAVRVEPHGFDAADEVLSQRFERNSASLRTPDFAAFENHGLHPAVGIQLMVRGSALDVFVRFRDRLRTDAKLLRRYNALKLRCEGMPMADYRILKSDFIAAALLQHPQRDRDATCSD